MNTTTTETEAQRQIRLTRIVLGNHRQQLAVSKAEREAAIAAGETDVAEAHLLEIEVYRTLVYDLEQVLGSAAYEREATPAAAPTGERCAS